MPCRSGVVYWELVKPFVENKEKKICLLGECLLSGKLFNILLNIQYKIWQNFKWKILQAVGPFLATGAKIQQLDLIQKIRTAENWILHHCINCDTCKLRTNIYKALKLLIIILRRYIVGKQLTLLGWKIKITLLERTKWRM